MNIDNEWTWLGVGAVAAIGFLAGLARSFVPAAPAIFGWAVVAAYIAMLVVVGVWWASCTTCASPQSYDSTRALDFMVTLFWGGLSVAGILMVTWLGATCSGFVARSRSA
jgi:hypothetical protein